MTDTATGFPLPQKGGCRCGERHLQVTAALRFVFAWRCHDRQQPSASALGMVVDTGAFAIEDAPREAGCGNRGQQFTCPDRVGWPYAIADSVPDVAVVRPSTLADHGSVRPVAQIFTDGAPMAVPPSFAKRFSDLAPLLQAFAAGGIKPGQP